EWVGPEDEVTPEDRAEFDALTHGRVVITHPQVDPAAGHTPQQILASHRWAAGLIARATLRLRGEMAYRAQQKRHGCHPQWDQGEKHLTPMGSYCGNIYEDSVLRVHWEYPPEVTLEVIPADAEGWVQGIRQLIADLIIGDQKPAPPPAPEPTHPG